MHGKLTARDWRMFMHVQRFFSGYDSRICWVFFRYTVTEARDGEFGRRLDNGSWTGMIGQLERRVMQTSLLMHNSNIRSTLCSSTITLLSQNRLRTSFLMVNKNMKILLNFTTWTLSKFTIILKVIKSFIARVLGSRFDGSNYFNSPRQRNGDGLHHPLLLWQFFYSNEETGSKWKESLYSCKTVTLGGKTTLNYWRFNIAFYINKTYIPYSFLF